MLRITLRVLSALVSRRLIGFAVVLSVLSFVIINGYWFSNRFSHSRTILVPLPMVEGRDGDMHPPILQLPKGAVHRRTKLSRPHSESTQPLSKSLSKVSSPKVSSELNSAPPDVMAEVGVAHRSLIEAFDRETRLPLLQDPTSVLVQLDTPLHDVSEQFLSVTLDSCAVQYNWSFIDFAAQRIVNMARGLAPAMLRVGGTHQGFLVFEPEGVFSHELHQNQPTEVNCYPRREDRVQFPMTTVHYDAVNQFVRKAGWELVFGLNSLLRDDRGEWKSLNAEKLLRYSASKGYSVNWQLGNEPSHLSRVLGFSIDTAQLVRDFAILRRLMKSIVPSARYLSGPDDSCTSVSGRTFYNTFLNELDRGQLDVITWHQYYYGGPNAVLDNFTSPILLDRLFKQTLFMREAMARYQPGVELWLDETSNMYGGGAPGISDSYVAGFMWLDKLGIGALTNNSRVFRQTLAGNHYSLLSFQQDPLPDYWLSVLHKKLIGKTVLYVLNSMRLNRDVRIYAHCARNLYPRGSVVLLLLNLRSKVVRLSLLNQGLSTSQRDVYWLTPLDDILTSKQVTLNGRLLELVNDTDLPDLLPQSQSASDSISLPSLSFGFYVFKDAKATACT